MSGPWSWCSFYSGGTRGDGANKWTVWAAVEKQEVFICGQADCRSVREAPDAAYFALPLSHSALRPVFARRGAFASTAHFNADTRSGCGYYFKADAAGRFSLVAATLFQEGNLKDEVEDSS